VVPGWVARVLPGPVGVGDFRQNSRGKGDFSQRTIKKKEYGLQVGVGNVEG
jgi:hypothetical protein